MVISEVNKFVYIAPAHCASRNVSGFLCEYCDGLWVDDRNLRQYAGMHGVEVPEQYLDYFVLTTVRDPYDRLVSIWRKQTNGKGSFLKGSKFSEWLPEFFGSRWCRGFEDLKRISGPQVAFLRGSNVPFSKINLIRVENLEESIRQLPFTPDGDYEELQFYKKVNIAEPNRVRRRSVQPKPERGLGKKGLHPPIEMDWLTKHVINTVYHEDFEVLGYPKLRLENSCRTA